ncbi:DUF6270 domain-containing protein [Brevibacterium sp. 'Marine']|uniref:DUF6270 domain-containing protein n=1 Tax=Brevibacterium sp. 'Marine' TaxID=2725563 RepID=UPI002006F00C|nr:DUF6270 domain-containing protein [Brevibacterium sp. 'Marine']
MNIAIFGSCVSRDTCEFIPGANVLEYVARQSVTSLISPHGDRDVDISGLESPFQTRMVESDLLGSGADRVISHNKEIDVVLIDLVDERRGFWLFPDSTTITNSLEIESCGAADWAVGQGAELIEFATERHFEAWKHGFELLVTKLRDAQMWDRTILLDIEWARVFSGSLYPANETIAKLGRRWRQAQRGIRNAERQLSSGHGVSSAWKQLWNLKPTDAEEFADRAVRANHEYVRYRDFARSMVAATVTRESWELRINGDHKWGPQPFHYRDGDYKSVVESILVLYQGAPWK